MYQISAAESLLTDPHFLDAVHLHLKTKNSNRNCTINFKASDLNITLICNKFIINMIITNYTYIGVGRAGVGRRGCGGLVIVALGSG